MVVLLCLDAPNTGHLCMMHGVLHAQLQCHALATCPLPFPAWLAGCRYERVLKLAFAQRPGEPPAAELVYECMVRRGEGQGSWPETR